MTDTFEMSRTCRLLVILCFAIVLASQFPHVKATILSNQSPQNSNTLHHRHLLQHDVSSLDHLDTHPDVHGDDRQSSSYHDSISNSNGPPKHNDGTGDDDPPAKSEDNGFFDDNEPANSPDSSLSSSSSLSASSSSSSTSPKKAKKFMGVPLGMISDVNVTRLSLGIFNFIKKNKIQSMVDFGCHSNIHWMPQLISQLEFEIPSFKFYCVEDVANEKFIPIIKEIYQDLPDVDFILAPLGTEEAVYPQADFFFGWRAFHELGPSKSWVVFKSLRRHRCKFIALGNNRGAENKLTKMRQPNDVMNVLRTPFYLNPPDKILGDLTGPNWPHGRKGQQLIFYDIKNMRPGVL